MENIKIVRLIGGEEIICKVRNTDERVEVQFPLCAYPSSEEGQMTLKPWIYVSEVFTEDAWISINPLSIITIVTPFNEMSEAWKNVHKQNFSKIVVPTAEEKKIFLN